MIHRVHLMHVASTKRPGSPSRSLNFGMLTFSTQSTACLCPQMFVRTRGGQLRVGDQRLLLAAADVLDAPAWAASAHSRHKVLCVGM